MDLKKNLALPEQFLCPKGKVLSGFGLGVVVSVLVLAVLFLSHFLKAPSLQGFQTVRVNSSLTTSNESMNFDEKGSVWGNTQMENSTEQVKNGSFVLEEERASFSGKEGAVIEKTMASTSLIGNEEENRERQNTSMGNDVFDKANLVKNNNTNVNVVSTESQKVQSDSYEECDFFDGKWVGDDSKPYYPGGSCPYIDRAFECHLNRRPDEGFLKWKWQPNGCDIPR